jgi:hypothetical protein
VVVRRDSGIAALADLPGKRASLLGGSIARRGEAELIVVGADDTLGAHLFGSTASRCLSSV